MSLLNYLKGPNFKLPKDGVRRKTNPSLSVFSTAHCKKEMKCSGDSEILRKKFRDTTQITSCISDSRVVSRTISCTISESPLHHTYSHYCRKSLPAWSPWGSSSSASSPPSCHSTATLKIQIVVSLIPSFSLSLSLFPPPRVFPCQPIFLG